ncbi:MAG: hemagglutinin repeat-containing protein [Enterobacteriaceae bacterium]|jgi:hemolysin|nr:hemagglutinin repeat-containing protein [Enterobacteriaceae bacterium]
MKKKKFRLSPTGKLAASMAIILATCSSSFADGITPAGDSAHRPDVSIAGNGATVVNIVAPSDSGLSHNQYKDFNVSQMGAVLNNSLAAGQSELAGQLSANSHLNGQAATIILNEVISRNPSLLLGKQEIFGMAADYVLANPNGITCNGCGFINTNQASLVVGNPLVENGTLQGFSTLDNQKALQIRNSGLSHNDVLNLIAPKMDINGKIITTKALNIITGNNQISADGQVLASKQARIGALDSYYLGSMQAGRIRLLNTAQGSGVNIQGKMSAADGIAISSQGDVKLQAANLQGGDISLEGQNLLSEGRLNKSSSFKEKTDKGAFSGGYTSKTKINESVARTQLSGKNITLVANRNDQITATDIDGDNIDITGANLKLDSQPLHQVKSDTNNQWKLSWEYNVTEGNEKHLHEGNSLKARENVHLTANEGNVEIRGSKITAGNQIAVSAKNDINVTGIVESSTDFEKGYKKNHTAELQTGNWSTANTSQKMVSSELKAGGDLGINAGGNAEIIGSELHSGKNTIISAGKQTKIAVQTLVEGKSAEKNKTYWGGIGGGSNKGKSEKSETQLASEISADGKILLNGTEGITITGSQIKAHEGAYVNANDGKLIIDNAVSNLTKTVDERTGTVFNITKNTNRGKSNKQTSTGSQLVSDADLKLLSNQDINVIGSLVKSMEELNIDTSGDINVLAAEIQNQNQQEKTNLNLLYYAHEAQDKQYRAGAGFEHNLDSQNTTLITQQQAELNGGNFVFNAGKNATFNGAKLVTTKGGASIAGDNIALTAAEDRTTTESLQEQVRGGIFATGGMDKFGGGVDGGYTKNTQTQGSTTAVVSKAQINGNLELNATGELKQQGTQYQVQGTYLANAGRVNNQATENTQSHSTGQLQVGGEINVTSDYSMLSRPIEKTVNAAKDGKLDTSVAKAGVPNAGVELAMNGNSHYTNTHQSDAVVTTVNAGDIKVDTHGDIYDQGTQYQANEGGVSLTAGSHTSEAAYNRQNSSSATTTGKAQMRVYTSTGSDLSVNGKGDGSYQAESSSNSAAITGSINARNGISVQTTRDARYQGTNMNAGSGRAEVNAGGNLQFDQATSRKEQNSQGHRGEASLTVGNNPDGNNFAGSAGVGYSTNQQISTTAHTSTITGGQGTNLYAGNNLTLQGANVSGKQVDLAAQRGEIALNSAEDTVNNNGWNFDVHGRGSVSNKARNAEGNDSNSGNNAGTENSIIDNTLNIGGGVKFGVDQLNKVTYQNSQISGGNVTLTSGRDTSFRGANIDAEQITGNIGGGFSVESLKNKTDSLNIGLDTGLGYSKTTKGDEATATADSNTPQAAATDEKPSLKARLADLKERLMGKTKGFDGKFKGNYDTLNQEIIGTQSTLNGTQGVNLNIAGDTTLTGSRIDSTQGQASVNSQQVNYQSLTGYDRGRNMGVNVSSSAADLASSAQKDLFSGKMPFVKNESHDTEIPATHSGIKGRN